MTDRVLNYRTASAIGDIIEIAQTAAKVTWVYDDESLPRHGVARHLVTSPETAGFLGAEDDVRDAYLRVTGKSGWEEFFSVQFLIEKILDNTFLQHNWS